MKKLIISMVLAASMALPMVAHADTALFSVTQNQAGRAAVAGVVTAVVAKETKSPVKGILAGVAATAVDSLVEKHNHGAYNSGNVKSDLAGVALGYTFVKAF